MKSLLAAFAFIVGATGLSARVDLLLIPPQAAVPGLPGVEFMLHLNNPTDRDAAVQLPHPIFAVYASTSGRGRVRLELADGQGAVRSVPAMSRRPVGLRLADPIPGAGGFVSLRLENPETNAIMFELTSADPAPPPPLRAPPAAPRPPPLIPERDLDLTSDLENTRRHVFSYDPIYFAVGWRERFNARFQFSFKYRIFERGPPGEEWPLRLIRDFYVGYTQTSLWDLETFSKPFYDSSYKPTAFLLHDFEPAPGSNWRFKLQGGLQHESNGKGGGSAPVVPTGGLISSETAGRHPFDSRSVNSLYLAPTVRWMGERDFFIEARARGSYYYDTEDNPDLARFRGYVELTLRSGRDRGFQASVHARGKPGGHGSLELNLTWPTIQTPFLRLILPPSLGGYAQIQYFNGYGESLLDYDVRRKDQLRFGWMLVR